MKNELPRRNAGHSDQNLNASEAPIIGFLTWLRRLRTDRRRGEPAAGVAVKKSRRFVGSLPRGGLIPLIARLLFLGVLHLSMTAGVLLLDGRIDLRLLGLAQGRGAAAHRQSGEAQPQTQRRCSNEPVYFHGLLTLETLTRKK